MKILWLTENYFPQRGGMAQSCDRIVYNLRQAGFFIHVLHVSNRGRGFVTEQKQQGSYTCVPVGSDLAHSLNMLSIFMEQKMDIEDVDFMVAFGGYVPVFAAPVLARWFDIKLVTLIRGNDFDSAVFSPKRRENLFYAIEQSYCIAAVSSPKRQRIQALFPHKRVAFIPNGISGQTWKTAASHLAFAKKWRTEHAGGKIVIGLFGQLKAKKGIDFFMQALAYSGQKDHFHLLFVGDIADELLEALKQSAVSFTHLPFQDKYELLSYYPACHVVGIPSFYDGMPNVLLEAGALGIPPLSANTDGMADVLKGLSGQFVFSPADVHACSAQLIRLSKTNSEALKNLGKSLQKHIFEHFSEEAETQKYMELFDS